MKKLIDITKPNFTNKNQTATKKSPNHPWWLCELTNKLHVHAHTGREREREINFKTSKKKHCHKYTRSNNHLWPNTKTKELNMEAHEIRNPFAPLLFKKQHIKQRTATYILSFFYSTCKQVWCVRTREMWFHFVLFSEDVFTNFTLGTLLHQSRAPIHQEDYTFIWGLKVAKECYQTLYFLFNTNKSHAEERALEI